MITTDVEVLRQLCREWQEKLGLLHWTIRIYINRYFDMPGEFGGICYPKIKKLTAIIELLHPDDYDPDRMTVYDMEHTLVHELLHLHFVPFAETSEDGIGVMDAGMKGIAMEQAIEQISRTLVNLKRSQGSIKQVLPPLQDPAVDLHSLPQRYIEKILAELGIDDYRIEAGTVKLPREDLLKVAERVGFPCQPWMAVYRELGWTWRVKG